MRKVEHIIPKMSKIHKKDRQKIQNQFLVHGQKFNILQKHVTVTYLSNFYSPNILLQI